jgi:hypothetical protein
VRSQVEEGNHGKIVAINLETGAFEVANDSQKAKKNRFTDRQGQDELKVVVLDEDVAQVFTTPESVNKALRALIEAMS